MKIKIFVSYAHADMKPRPGFKDSRISLILQDIAHELRCNDVRSEFVILRDEAGLLFAGDQLDTEITNAIEEAHIGLVLVSRSYCYSEECRKELVQLIRKQKRLCIVETENAWSGTYESSLKAEFPDLSRIIRSKFWETRNNLDVDFGWPSPATDTENAKYYYKAVRFTKQSLENMRHEILEAQAKDVSSQVEELPEQMVFIASPTGDVRQQTERLRKTLNDKGYSVFQFDHKRHVNEESDVEDVIRTACEKCQIAIQLLGTAPGGRIGDSELYLVPQQNKAISETEVPLFVWEAPWVDRTECSDEYQAFLNSIQCHSSSYQEFETYIVKQVEKIAKEQEAARRRQAVREEAKPAKSRHPFVGIDYAAADRAIAEVVLNAIVEHANVEPLPFDMNNKDLERAVSDNDGIVMVYGNSSAGQKRVSAHFGIVQRFKNRTDNAWFDVAIGNGLDELDDGSAPLLPGGPNVHVIGVDPAELSVDRTALSRFVEEIKNNAMKRYQ